MIVDSSALIAMILDEPRRDEIVESLENARWAAAAAPTLVETEMVLAARVGDAARITLHRVLDVAGITTIPFDDAHRALAVDAFVRFGRGRHPAALNFGDCITYAVAKRLNAPLLCVGDDFRQTDLALVLP